VYHKKLFLTLVVCVTLSSLLSAGCAKKNEDTTLNLPEQESKQLKAAEKGIVKVPETATAGKAVQAEPGAFKKFYVYADQGYFKNHFIPSGWMGDVGDVKIADAWPDKPYSRKTSIRIIYTAEKKQGAGWTGIYWQDPANNWGNLKGGYDLSGATKLTFWARGEKGGEVISEFKIGGIRGEISDSASVSIGPVTLTPEWKEYTIDLKNEDLSLIIGGFSFVISSMENPQGATFYLDEIAYE
jgi:hypothetical protein